MEPKVYNIEKNGGNFGAVILEFLDIEIKFVFIQPMNGKIYLVC